MYQLACLVVLTFLLRSLPGILRFSRPGGDAHYNLLCAERIRENRLKRPREIRGLLRAELYDYPPLFHYFLALFPRTVREHLAPFVSAITDSIHVVIIYFFTLYLFQLPQLSQYATDASWTASTAALLFATSPALLYYGVGPRAFDATPRPLCELFVTVTFFFALVFYCHGDYWALLLSGLFAALTLLTSKFGAQVLVFFSIGLAAFLRAPLLLVIPAVGIVLALAVSKGHYWKVLTAQTRYLILYQKMLVKRHPIIIQRSNPAYFKNVVSSGLKGDFKDFARSLINLLNNNTYVILVIRNVLFFVLLFLCITHWQMITSGSATIFLGSWIAVSLIVFFLTSLRPFLFLGEAERYMEHSVPAQVILLSFLFAFLTSSVLLIVLLIYHGLFYLANITLIYRAHKVTMPVRNSKEQLFNWFKQNGITGKKLLTIPGDYWEFAYRTDNIVFRGGSLTEVTADEFESLWEDWTWPHRDIQRLIRDYKLQMVVVNKTRLSYAFQRGWHYDLSPYVKIFENDTYTVYQTAQCGLDAIER